MKKLSTNDISRVALGVALIALCSWLSIPAEVPFTLQTFAVCLVTAILGLRLGVWAVVVYLLLGFVGAPVFAGFRGGFGVLLGTTGGYLVGFIFTAIAVGLWVRLFGRKPLMLAVGMAIGILLCYAFGTVWFIVVYTRKVGSIGILSALGLCVFPYLVPDAVKIAVAAPLACRLAGYLDKTVVEYEKR